MRVLTPLLCLLALLKNCFCASLVVFCSSFVKTSIAVSIINFIFAIAGTFLNTMVLFVFLKSKNLRRKNSYVAIMTLSATDLTVVTIVIQLCFYLRQSLKLWAHGACLYSICFNIVSKTTPSIIVSNFTHHYEY